MAVMKFKLQQMSMHNQLVNLQAQIKSQRAKIQIVEKDLKERSAHVAKHDEVCNQIIYNTLFTFR